MPASKDAPPKAAEPQEVPAVSGASSSPEPDAVPDGLLPAGVYEYVANFATVYALPLTARPASADGPATVFDWAFGCPNDGRWQASRKKPNQLPDNESPADLPKEG